MKVRMRSSDDQVVIYREGAGVVIYAITLAIACFALAALFFYISDDKAIPWAFGGLFIVAGGLLLTASPEFIRRIVKDKGAVLLVADKAGVSIAPMLGKAPVSYRWADVSQIFLTRKLVSKEIGERSYCNNQIIVCFRRDNIEEKAGLIERSKDQLWRSPNGRSISIIDFPRGEIDRVRNELIRFFNAGDVQMFGKVIFDYAESTEQLQP